VPDVGGCKLSYDELMPMLGFQPCFDNGYFPTDWQGSQLFVYAATDDEPHSRYQAGPQHIAFLVSTRADVNSTSTPPERSAAEPRTLADLLRRLAFPARASARDPGA